MTDHELAVFITKYAERLKALAERHPDMTVKPTTEAVEHLKTLNEIIKDLVSIHELNYEP